MKRVEILPMLRQNTALLGAEGESEVDRGAVAPLRINRKGPMATSSEVEMRRVAKIRWQRGSHLERFWYVRRANVGTCDEVQRVFCFIPRAR